MPSDFDLPTPPLTPSPYVWCMDTSTDYFKSNINGTGAITYGNLVGYWQDLSGNGHHLVYNQFVTSQPTLSTNGVQFGIKTPIGFGSDVTWEGYAIYMVWNFIDYPSTNCPIMSRYSGANGFPVLTILNTPSIQFIDSANTTTTFSPIDSCIKKRDNILWLKKDDVSLKLGGIFGEHEVRDVAPFQFGNWFNATNASMRPLCVRSIIAYNTPLKNHEHKQVLDYLRYYYPKS
jgi:hypothetical protein